MALLITFGVIIDTEDFAGRTPLHIACYYNSIECIKILLLENASPLKKTVEGKTPSDLTDNTFVKYLLSRIESMYMLYSDNNPKRLMERVSNSLKFILAEFERIYNKK